MERLNGKQHNSFCCLRALANALVAHQHPGNTMTRRSPESFRRAGAGGPVLESLSARGCGIDLERFPCDLAGFRQCHDDPVGRYLGEDVQTRLH